MKIEHYLLTLKAEDRPGLLHQLTGIINKKQIPIVSLTAARTDIHDIVLVSMEIEAPEKALQPLMLRLENVIEVFAIEAIKINKAICQRSAYFRLDKEVLNSPQAEVIRRYDAQIVDLHPNAIVVSKSGNEAAIRQLYNALEGRFLQGFSQTGLIADSKLIAHEDIERVIRLAA